MRPVPTRAAAGAVLLACALPLFAGACSKSDDTTTTAASSTTAAAADNSTTTANQVNAGASATIKEFEYNPGDIKVKVNQTVTWTNQGAGKHTVTADPGQSVTFKSPTMQPGNTFVFSFSQPGTYTYFCSIHGKDKMSGTVVVEP